PGDARSASRARALRRLRSSCRASGCAGPGTRAPRRARSTVRQRLAATLRARAVVLLDVALELGVGSGETVAAVSTDDRDVEQVVRLGRVGSGLDRREARIADRAGRQARVHARVVRARVLKLGLPQLAGPLVEH